jgi:fructose-specific phosphotransferase system IIA component
MLMIIMHNKKDYLEALVSLARRNNITDVTIIEKKDIGVRLIGQSASFLFHRGNLSSAYDKAFVAVVKDEQKARHLLDLIENDDDLNLLNLEDKGFICTVPFQQIKHLELESTKIKEKELAMKMGDYLKEDKILLSLKARKKEEAIKEIATLLKGAKEITDFETFLKDVFEREDLSTTGIGHEVAIPHARTNAAKDFVIAFGRSGEGVEFNSLDGQPAKLIFLMATPKEKGLSTYLKTLAHLSRLLQKESFRNSLLRATNPIEIIEQFKRAEA